MRIQAIVILLGLSSLQAVAQVVVVPPTRPPGRPPVVVVPPTRPPGRPPVVVVPPTRPPGRPPVVVVPPTRPPGRPPVVVVPPPTRPPVYVNPPQYRPAPFPFPPVQPGAYVQLQGYAQPSDTYGATWYLEYGIQVTREYNGLQSVTLYPGLQCRDPYYGGCPYIDTTPITLWLTEQADQGCGSMQYIAVARDRYSRSDIGSVVVTDHSRRYCSDNYTGLLTLQLNHYNGSQDWLVGYRTY